MTPVERKLDAELLARHQHLEGVRLGARWQWALWLCLWVTVGAGLVVLQMREREAILQQQTDQLRTQNHVAALLMRTQVQTTNTALEALQRTLGVWLQHPERGTELANTHLSSFVNLLPAVRTLAVIDEEGRLLLSSRRDIVGADAMQRPFF